MSLSQKIERSLRFLLGLRNPRIASQLAARGFSQTDLDEGWELLRKTARVRLAPAAPAPQDPKVLTELDAWENEWFPMASASLKRRFPEVHAKFFENLNQTDGPAVMVSVATFLERYAALGKADGGFGADGKAARALLEQRGLNAAVIRRAKDLLEQLGSVAPEAEPVEDVESRKEEAEAAEAALWAWYLEWSQIARIAIKQSALLRQLGFGVTRGPGRPASGAEDDTETGVATEGEDEEEADADAPPGRTAA